MKNLTLSGLLLTLTLIPVLIFGQSNDLNDQEAFLRGEELVQKARDTVFKERKFADIQTLYINLEGKALETAVISKYFVSAKPTEEVYRFDVEDRYFLEFPHKIRVQRIARLNENQGSKSIEVFNEGKHLAGLEFLGPKTPESIPNVNYPVKNAEWLIWSDLFHFILNNYEDEDAQFRFAGIANLPSGKANVIDVVGRHTKWKNEKLRLFFDANSNHLVLTESRYEYSYGGETLNSRLTQVNGVTRCFLTNHKNIDGVVIPQTVKLSSKVESADNEINDKGERGKISSTISTESLKELTVTKFKVNPKFTKGIFDSPKNLADND